MARVKGELAARCELAMMGKVVACSNDEVNSMTNYILKTLGLEKNFEGVDFLKEYIHRYNTTNEVKHIVVNTVHGEFLSLSYLIDTHYEGEPAPFETDYGCGYPCSFCYVFNMTVPDLSEFGDCFFEKREDGFYHRVS